MIRMYRQSILCRLEPSKKSGSRPDSDSENEKGMREKEIERERGRNEEEVDQERGRQNYV